MGKRVCYPHPSVPIELRCASSLQRDIENISMGIKGSNVLQELTNVQGFDITEQVICDPMHNWHGFVALLVNIWTNKKKKYFTDGRQYLSEEQIAQIERRMQEMSIPSCITRIPTSLHEVSRWKASEASFFMSFMMLACMQPFLSKVELEMVQYLTLVFRLQHKKHSTHEEQCIGDELRQVVSAMFTMLYGKRACTKKTHDIFQHEGEQLKNLSFLTCFAFESFNGTLTSNITATKQLGIHIAHRFADQFAIHHILLAIKHLCTSDKALKLYNTLQEMMHRQERIVKGWNVNANKVSFKVHHNVQGDSIVINDFDCALLRQALPNTTLDMQQVQSAKYIRYHEYEYTAQNLGNKSDNSFACIQENQAGTIYLGQIHYFVIVPSNNQVLVRFTSFVQCQFCHSFQTYKLASCKEHFFDAIHIQCPCVHACITEEVRYISPLSHEFIGTAMELQNVPDVEDRRTLYEDAEVKFLLHEEAKRIARIEALEAKKQAEAANRVAAQQVITQQHRQNLSQAGQHVASHQNLANVTNDTPISITIGQSIDEDQDVMEELLKLQLLATTEEFVDSDDDSACSGSDDD